MKIKLLTLLFLIITFKSFSQPVPISVSVKSPEVNAFNRFIETPISEYTGVPNISIPLYEIQIKGITIPITLEYHAGGIRVDENATWVGLGWSLNYGGQITRKSKGVADEYFYLKGINNNFQSINYFMNLPNLGAIGNSENQSARYERIKNSKYGTNDYMPDEFYYSVLGYSGRFMFSQNKNKFILFPKEDIDVSANVNSNKINFFELSLPSGITVEFGKEGYSSQAQRVNNFDSYINNSWMIKSVRNNYNDSISYSYENYNYRLRKFIGQQYKIHSKFSADLISTNSDDAVYDSRIKTIVFPGGRVEFQTTPRIDMPSLALAEIKVYDENNNLIKNIKFTYSYFNGSDYELQGYDVNGISNDYKHKRLKLDNISIVSPNISPLIYKFDYHVLEKMPSKYSFSQDHWGFFNGIPNQSQFGLIPNLSTQFIGGDRRVKSEFSKAFSLKSIIYPEGGKREFIYESNTAGIWNTPTDLLATYQDDNFIEKSEGINVSGWSRASNYPSPDQITNQVRYFKKKFTISGVSFQSVGKNWKISTNFGISDIENNSTFSADNVEFKLEKINYDGSKTVLKRFNTTDSQFPYGSIKKRNGVDSSQVLLSLGDYEMTVAITYANAPNSPADMQPYNLSFLVNYRTIDPAKNMVNVGGLRIKNINYYDSNNELVKRKKYEYVNPYAYQNLPNFTSGRIISFPQYIQHRIKQITNNSNGVVEFDGIINYTSSSIVPLETTSGSYAGYEYVDEYDEDYKNTQNNLRTGYHFSFERPYFSQYYPLSSMNEYEPKEYMRGKILDKTYYKGSTVLRKESYDYNYKSTHLLNLEDEDYVEEINTDLISWQGLLGYAQTTDFSSFPDDFFDIAGGLDNCVYFRYSAFNNNISAHFSRPIPGYPGWSSNSMCQYTQSVPYFKRLTGFDKINSKITTIYEDPLHPLIIKENFFYDKTPIHYQVSKIINQSSSGENIQLTNTYATDLVLGGDEEIARQALVRQHDYLSTFEVSKTINNKTESSKTAYQIDPHTNFVLPKAIITNTGANAADEIRSKFTKFDNKGNILEVEPKLGLKICYLWSYNNQYPICEIKNANYATIESILGGPIAVSSFAAANPTDAEVNTIINTLKKSDLLKDAHITSYTHKPLVGITSMTDSKGMTTYYEYDEFQRLKNVKDQKGNILKNNTYHYKN